MYLKINYNNNSSKNDIDRQMLIDHNLSKFGKPTGNPFKDISPSGKGKTFSKNKYSKST